MANKSEIKVKAGSGFTSLLTLLFIALKLTGYISWPWVWVLAPVWIPIVFAIVVVLVLGISGNGR